MNKENKELSQEQLEKVAGGEMSERFCRICCKDTTPKLIQVDNGSEFSCTCVCSVCGNSYE